MTEVRKRIRRLTRKQAEAAVLLLEPYTQRVEIHPSGPRTFLLDIKFRNGFFLTFGSMLAVEQFLASPDRDAVALAPLGSDPRILGYLPWR